MSRLKTTVEEFTTPSPLTVKPTDSLNQIHNLMEENGIRHVPIVSEDQLEGIISQRDLKVALMFDTKTTKTAADIMVTDVCTISMNASLEDAAFQMADRKIGSLIVEDEQGKIYGIFTSTDALNALIEAARGVIS